MLPIRHDPVSVYVLRTAGLYACVNVLCVRVQAWERDPDCWQQGTRVRNALEYLGACRVRYKDTH